MGFFAMGLFGALLNLIFFIIFCAVLFGAAFLIWKYFTTVVRTGLDMLFGDYWKNQYPAGFKGYKGKD